VKIALASPSAIAVILIVGVFNLQLDEAADGHCNNNDGNIACSKTSVSTTSFSTFIKKKSSHGSSWLINPKNDNNNGSQRNTTPFILPFP
jgi:hypothetical protein